MKPDLLQSSLVVRRPLPDDPLEQAQPTLWTFKRHAYHVLVTNLPLQPESVWRFYTKRAQAVLGRDERDSPGVPALVRWLGR